MWEMIKYRFYDALADLTILACVMVVIIIILTIHEFIYKRIRDKIIRKRRSKYVQDKKKNKTGN